ncbi:MAG: lactate utilization protein C [Candidatus Parabeggiatoa sp. nov. 3]|jgi:L-lactate dehydrogenase complex protein LldG|nr:MAG: lactate utilization protein C [Gammaproteobacteria bacterium]RKZ65919.1 MAG: lactate utilization protein C [Gammaproteobacteria bacterium]RKZ78494.1 MAG: lactate utilization protein C [Gammaproteobacteria bacterium]
MMNQSRNTILNHIRQSLGYDHIEANTLETLEARLANHPVHEQPVLKQALIPQFIQQLEKVAGTFETIPNIKDIPFVILDFLQQQQLPEKLVVDSRLKTLPWPNKLQLAYRAAQADDMVSVSCAFAGIAETGSLVLLSSLASPTTLNFLPDNHIVILYKENLVAFMEEVWTRLRAQAIPRTVNIITGPSRTADIEQTIQLGAHGPRRLHVVLVERSM